MNLSTMYYRTEPLISHATTSAEITPTYNKIFVEHHQIFSKTKPAGSRMDRHELPSENALWTSRKERMQNSVPTRNQVASPLQTAVSSTWLRK
jgi:hypothetical protein